MGSVHTIEVKDDHCNQNEKIAENVVHTMNSSNVAKTDKKHVAFETETVKDREETEEEFVNTELKDLSNGNTIYNEDEIDSKKEKKKHNYKVRFHLQVKSSKSKEKERRSLFDIVVGWLTK